MTRGLSDKEGRVLKKRDSGMPLAELAKEMGTNKETIRRLEAKGRKKLHEHKEGRFMVRLSASERQNLREQAQRLGLTASAYIRMLIHREAGMSREGTNK